MCYPERREFWPPFSGEGKSLRYLTAYRRDPRFVSHAFHQASVMAVLNRHDPETSLVGLVEGGVKGHRAAGEIQAAHERRGFGAAVDAVHADVLPLD